MSNRAMAQRFMGGGRTMPSQSLDLLGLREAKANRMADADMEREVKLQKLIDSLNETSESSSQVRKLLEKEGIPDTPENRKAYNNAISAIKINNAKLMSGAEGGKALSTKQFYTSPRGDKAVKFGLEGSEVTPAIKAQDMSKVVAHPGEEVAFSPWTDLFTTAFGHGHTLTNTETDSTMGIGPDGKPTMLPSKSRSSIQGGGGFEMPAKIPAGLSGDGISAAPAPEVPTVPEPQLSPFWTNPVESTGAPNINLGNAPLQTIPPERSPMGAQYGQPDITQLFKLIQKLYPSGAF